MIFYDCMTCSNNRFSSMPRCLFSSFPAIGLALYRIFIWTQHVDIWYQQRGTGVGKALLRRYCWVMRLVYRSRDLVQDLMRIYEFLVIAPDLGKL